MGNSMLDIRNLLWHTVSKWRTVMIAAVVGAVVAGGIGAVISIEPEVDVDVEATQVQIDTLNAEIAELTDEQAVLEQYMEESLYANMDYLTTTKTLFMLHVLPTGTDETSTEIQASELVNLYNNSVMSQELYQRINDQLGYSMNYTEQMFTTDTEGGFINFIIQSSSQEDNEILGDIIVHYIEELYSDMNANYYPHTLNIGSFYSTKITSEDINNSNKEKQEELDAGIEKIAELQGEINTLQEQITEQDATGNMISLIIFYIILGFIFFAFMAIFYIIVKPFTLNQIQGGSYIEKVHDVNILAMKPMLQSRKNIVDNLIYKICCRGKSKTEQAFLEYLILSINVHTLKDEELHLTGTIATEEIESLAMKIQDKIHAKLSIGGAVTEDINSLESLEKAKSVILVEKRFTTSSVALEQEVSYIRKVGKEIKGAILL